MTTPTLGRLERVPLREVWLSESSDFTPWLARPENIALLGETLSLDLEVETAEKRVGPFRADILCKNTLTDAWVLIENQLERTDHIHLGQLLTYAAGLQAVTIVWVAESFTDEHRAALDWLNRITAEHVNFFGLEIEAWRIGESLPAPKFNVVCQPNDWSRDVSARAQQAEAGLLSERQQSYLAFWQALVDRLNETQSILRHGSPRGRNYFFFSLGRSGFNLMASCSDGSLWANVRCSDPDLWPALQAIKADAAREAGMELLEDYKADRDRNSLSVTVGDLDLDNPDAWSPIIAELQSKLEKLHAVFAPRIRNLEPIA